jgi:short-subunit dehydrogenase
MKRQMKRQAGLRESVYIITGASSGIGRALAIAIARPGVVLGLIGRDTARLAETAQGCSSRGAWVHVLPVDVRRRDELRAMILQFDLDYPVDCVIASAGISVGTSPDGEIESEDETFDLLETNLIGALATALSLIPGMRKRRQGRVVFLSSIAAFSPLPDAAAYSGSKAALLAYGLAMRERLREDGINVNVVCPGFVTTPMAARYLGWKPFEISPEDAARRIVRGLDRNRAVIAFPWPLVFAARLQQVLPEALRQLGSSAFRFRVARRRERPGT